MEYTQNYALRKPGLNEYANVGDLNFNADKIDSQMKKNQDVDGEVYDPTSTSANAYESGDYVINPDDGLMYVCNGTTYGTWDSTKWDHTTEFEEIQKAMASGGESELADLHDVEITNPTNGQALLYDPTSSKWHNSDLPDADVTKTASGNPVEFSDGADAPLVKCVTEIQGSQDLHGYDKPWVGGAGRNKMPASLAGSQSKNGITIISDGNGTYSLSGTATAQTTIDFDLITSYEIPIAQSRGGTGCFNLCNNFTAQVNLRLFNDSVQVDSWSLNSVNKYSASYSSMGGKTINKISFMIANGETISGTVSPMFTEDGTSTYLAFIPYENICPITAYTQGTISVGASANLLNENASDIVNQETILSDGSLIYAVFVNVSGYIPVIPEMPITYGSWDSSINPQGGSINEFNKRIVCFDKNKQFIATIAETTVASSEPFSISGIIPSNCAYVRVPFYRHKSIMMLNYGTTLLPYQPYSEPTRHTATWTPAIYQGNADFIGSGSPSVSANKPVTSIADLSWTKSGSRFKSTDLASVIQKPSSASEVISFICEIYEARSASQTYNGAQGISVDTSGNILIYDANYASDTAENFVLARGSYKFAYPLATPTTEDITPTNLPIKSLFGYNHIESTTGDMEIEYFPAKEQPLIDLIAAASQHTYSTTAQKVGKWVDGSDLYEIAVATGGSVPTGGTLIERRAMTDYDILLYTVSTNRSVPTENLTKGSGEEETKEEPEELKEEIKEEPTEEVKEEPEEVKEEPVEEVKEEETKEPEEPETKETNEEEAKR